MESRRVLVLVGGTQTSAGETPALPETNCIVPV